METTHKALIKNLERTFNKYIRLRDTAIPLEGEVATAECISCGKAVIYGTSDCQAGHYVPKTTSATRFSEENVNVQCNRCNRWLRGNIHNYRKGMIDKYGADVEEEIWNQRGKSLKYTKIQLEELIHYYRNLVKDLQEIKGLK